jgi:TolA-binding protein
MKRTLASILFASLLLTGGAVRAADAVSLAAQQEAEERYKRLSATVEELQVKAEAQQKQISALSSEVNKLRDEIARNNNNAATQESIRELNKQIQKVDEVHVADNKRIQEALEKLGKAIRDMAAAPGPRPRPSNNDGPATPPGRTNPQPPAGGAPAVEDGFEHTIQSGDRLDLIVKWYREKNIMVTAKAIKDANPNVDWSRLQVGKKIFIPKPK